MRVNDKDERVEVKPQDYVLVTNGSLMTNSTFGDNKHIAPTNRNTDDLGLFNIWKNLAKKHEKFIGPIDKTKWMSYFITIKDYPEFFQRLERLTGSKPGTGGCITVKDSGWEISLILYDRDYFPNQRANNEDCLWGDGLFGERIGNYIKKPMAQCTGEEILLEILYHFNLMDMKDEVLAHAHVSTCMMPYITSQFMPRTCTDRPKVVPDACTNLGFIGQFVEVPGDVVFTVETSVRTATTAVYKMLHLDRPITPLFKGQYDIRMINIALKTLIGKDKIEVSDLPKINPLKIRSMLKQLVDFINSIPPVPEYYSERYENN